MGEAALRLPPPVIVERLAVEHAARRRALVAHYAVGPALVAPAAAVRAVVAGRIATGEKGAAPTAVLDVLLAGPQAPLGEARRLRWKVDEVDDLGAVTTVLDLVASVPSATPRRIDANASTWPTVRQREFERLLAWTAWRAQR
jgi:hypothetical protein